MVCCFTVMSFIIYAKFIDVVAALFQRFYPQRLESESGVGKISVGEKGMFMYHEILKRVQSALKERGYDVGPVNGLASKETIEALVAYQKDNNIPESGIPDQPTLYSLLLKLD